METIIAAVISGVVALVISLITNRAQAKATEALILHRLTELERKQDVHNSLITRVVTLEVMGKETRKDVDTMFDRIREVEKSTKVKPIVDG